MSSRLADEFGSGATGEGSADNFRVRRDPGTIAKVARAIIVPVTWLYVTVHIAGLSKPTLISYPCRRTVGLLQFGVLRLCLFEDGNVGIGVFPQGQEILIRRLGFGGVALQRIRAGEAQMRERADGEI